jgi:uncharacterized membrane protein YfcA
VSGQQLLVLLVAGGAGTAGAFGGLGGAVIMVPILVAVGMEPSAAAPLGLLAVATTSIAAAPRQLRQHLINHRLAAAIEVGSAAGAILGAMLALHVARHVVVTLLAVVVLVAAVSGGTRTGLRNHPDPQLTLAAVGEAAGRMGGAYELRGMVVPYRARRAGLGTALSGLVGLIAGVTGTSGGYLKTPIMSEVMQVPAKVAASTATFGSGITASAGLAVYLSHGTVPLELGPMAIAGAALGGATGARLQQLGSPAVVRRMLSFLLLGIAATLLLKGAT